MANLNIISAVMSAPTWAPTASMWVRGAKTPVVIAVLAVLVLCFLFKLLAARCRAPGPKGYTPAAAATAAGRGRSGAAMASEVGADDAQPDCTRNAFRESKLPADIDYVVRRRGHIHSSTRAAYLCSCAPHVYSVCM